MNKEQIKQNTEKRSKDATKELSEYLVRNFIRKRDRHFQLEIEGRFVYGLFYKIEDKEYVSLATDALPKPLPAKINKQTYLYSKNYSEMYQRLRKLLKGRYLSPSGKTVFVVEGNCVVE